jgi:hypothetical protein
MPSFSPLRHDYATPFHLFRYFADCHFDDAAAAIFDRFSIFISAYCAYSPLLILIHTLFIFRLMLSCQIAGRWPFQLVFSPLPAE